MLPCPDMGNQHLESVYTALYYGRRQGKTHLRNSRASNSTLVQLMEQPPANARKSLKLSPIALSSDSQNILCQQIPITAPKIRTNVPQRKIRIPRNKFPMTTLYSLAHQTLEFGNITSPGCNDLFPFFCLEEPIRSSHSTTS